MTLETVNSSKENLNRVRLNDILNVDKKSSWMLKGIVQETPIKFCRDEYSKESLKKVPNRVFSVRGLERGITDDIICANNRQTHVDTCQGFISSSFLKFR